MMTLIQDTLALWQDAERVLDSLPPTSPDHETVAQIVLELRAIYTRLTTALDWSHDELSESRAAIETGRELLRRVAARSPQGIAES